MCKQNPKVLSQEERKKWVSEKMKAQKKIVLNSDLKQSEKIRLIQKMTNKVLV